jgi:tetratricopeptide (TPR) repeat protein
VSDEFPVQIRHPGPSAGEGTRVTVIDVSFGDALRELYAAAGRPPHSRLISAGKQAKPPVLLNVKSLSDWLTGKYPPSDQQVVRLLVGFLQPLAETNPARPDGYQRRSVDDYWIRLWRRERERRANRGGRPEAPAPRRAGVRLGKPIGDYTALELEVHPAIELADQTESGSRLPQYVVRAHDTRLRKIIEAAGRGISRVAVMVGGSSTGKTRACWEAIQALPKSWRVWHPIDPTRPEAALAEIAEVGSNTVVWLNDAHHYLLTPDSRHGEKLAAGLNTLATDPGRTPVLVLVTIWPPECKVLTTTPRSGTPDVHPAARQLLTRGECIAVPDSFASEDLDALGTAAASDPQLRYALGHAPTGRITQQLAGVPELLRRYLTADSVAKPTIWASMDVRRLGHPLPIPHALLEQAVPGYLDDVTWTAVGGTWPEALNAALNDLGEPAYGILGPLTPIHRRPGESPSPNGHCYRLADYLEQTGRLDRAGEFPPATLWNAVAATVTKPDVLLSIGDQAQHRCRYHRAAQLYRVATECGDATALVALAKLHERAGNHTSAEALYRQAAHGGQAEALAWLGKLLERTGAQASAVGLYQRAAHGGDEWAVERLGELHTKAGIDSPEAGIVIAAHHGESYALDAWIWYMEQIGNHAGAEKYRKKLVEWVEGTGWRPSPTQEQVEKTERAGDATGAETVAVQAADNGDTSGLSCLASLRAKAGDQASAEALALKAAAYGATDALVNLAQKWTHASKLARAEMLYRQAIDRGGGRYVWYAVEPLASVLEQTGNDTGADLVRRFGLTDGGAPASSLEC